MISKINHINSAVIMILLLITLTLQLKVIISLYTKRINVETGALFIINIIYFVINVYFFPEIYREIYGLGTNSTDTYKKSIFVFIVFIIIPFLIILYSTYIITKNRKKNLYPDAIKKAVNNIPVGICFFKENGLIEICNIRMYNIFTEFFKSDFQTLAEFENCLEDPPEKVLCINEKLKTYVFPDGRVWKFAKNRINSLYEDSYVEYTATDITEIYEKKQQLLRDYSSQKIMTEKLRSLSKNITIATREEEILSFKMRLHDNIGRCIIHSKLFLEDKKSMSDINDIIDIWQNSLKILTSDAKEEYEGENVIEEIIGMAREMGLEVIVYGDLPKYRKNIYILSVAIRESITNSIKHANATEMYVKLEYIDNTLKIEITNNGKPPASDIKEGGGLSSLRNRIEKMGGNMAVKTYPVFKTVISIQVKEDVFFD